MNTRKLRVGLLLIAALMLISSCGVPSYLQCDVEVSRQGFPNNITASVTNCFINATEEPALLTSSSVHPKSPSYTFFYTITDKNLDNSSIRSEFNKLYSSEDKPRSASLIVNDDYGYVAECSYTIDQTSTKLRLFPFSSAESWTSPAGHVNKSTMNGRTDLDCTFDDSPLSDTASDPDFGSLNLKYKDLYDSEKTLILKRFNEEAFVQADSESTDPDYSVFQDHPAVVTTYINIYMAVNIVGSKTANFNNRFWSNLYYVGSFEIPMGSDD